jgi:D-alanyl-D-alanine carboxypeptidase/D-alanyl-D-alanine-endopeptidase (penicillin-binding protein 4)
MKSRPIQISRVVLHPVFLVVLSLFAYRAPLFAQQNQQITSEVQLISKLREIITNAELGRKIGVAVADTRSERMIFTHNGELPLNPASNMKLLTAAAALWELGPDFRMRTAIYGRVQGSAVAGGLFLKGYGDPTLRWSDLVSLARELEARGIRSVDEVAVDGSYFDTQILPPAFDQQPNEISPFRAAVGAVSVDRNAYVLYVRPGSEPNSPALFHLDIPGYFEVENKLITSDSERPNVVAIQNSKNEKLLLRLQGSVPIGISYLSYSRRVDNPLSYAGYAMVEALRSVRIRVPRRVRMVVVPNGTPLLVSKPSITLAEILLGLGKYSDNFVAEMIFKVIGAERRRLPGRSSDGVRVVLEMLKRHGIPLDRIAIVNGSGLFKGNLVAASHFAKLLVAVHNDTAIRAEFLAHLAIGGADGTLSDRFRDMPAKRIVRAKTGTLKDVIALSGYVLGPMPERVFAFSVIANEIAGKQHKAKSLADDIVRAIASFLWRR